MFFQVLVLIWSFQDILHSDAVPCEDHFLCTDDVCKSTNLGGCGPKSCPELEDKECREGRLLSLYEVEDDVCNCCPPTCVKYLKEGESCSRFVSEKFPKTMCGPMLECQLNTDKVYKCLRMSPKVSKCLGEVTDYEERDMREEVGIFETPPKCTEDGEYAPVQCFGTGLCHCVDKDSGEPIFGLEGSKPQSIASNMNCLCARHHQESLKLDCRLSINYVGVSTEEYEKAYNDCVQSRILHFFRFGGSKCLSNGNQDDIQCIHGVDPLKKEDICVCLVKDSFQSMHEYQPISHIDQLSCYKEDYMGPCGKIIQNRLKEENNTNQIWYGGKEAPKCSPDGFFDAVQINASNKEYKYCSDREGDQIEDFITSSEEAKKDMHCRCALARKYIDPMLGIPDCCENGNYECRQCQMGFCYCVDQNGRQIGLEVDQANIDKLECDNCCSS